LFLPSFPPRMHEEEVQAGWQLDRLAD
jgi:hypothetical protein